MIGLPLLAPFLPEIGGALMAIALIVAAAVIAEKFSSEGGGWLTYVLTAPLRSATSAISSALHAASGTLLDAHGDRIAGLLAGAAESIGNVLLYPARLFSGVHAALVYLWRTAVPGYVKAALAPVLSRLDGVRADIQTVRNAIATARSDAEHYADAQIASAVSDVKAWTREQVHAAESAAESYADEAVSKLRVAEQAAIANAVSLANIAEHDAQSAIMRAGEIAADIGAPVGRSLSDLEKYLDSLGLAGLVAAVPALGLLVNTIATESGLDSAACRSKVKGICRTDPNVWENLLGLLAPLGLALSLRELVKVANAIGPELAGVIRTAG